MALTEESWIEGFAGALGVPAPSADQREALLALAGVAAHASERTAAPLACWLAAIAGIEPERALALAKELTATFENATEKEATP